MCISILHAPGDDPMGYESSAERWSPVQSVEKILLSVVSMLAGKCFQLSCSIFFYNTQKAFDFLFIILKVKCQILDFEESVI